MAEPRDWQQLATGMAHMARDLLAQHSVQHTLDRIVAHTVDLVDGCEAAGIMVVHGSRVQTLAATDNVARASARWQGELCEGPCFDPSYRQQQMYRIPDMATAEDRWPRYAPKARELGVGSTMGFLLFTDGQHELGALGLYSPRPTAFTDRSEQVGWVLASHAAVALSSARLAAGLHEAIGTRQDIGEALGILMERYKVGEQEAFRMLRKLSQDHNTKIRDLAHTINTGGELPESPTSPPLRGSRRVGW